VEQRASRKRLIENAGFLILFLALAYIVLFWRLGVPTFWDPDEAHYAETSRQMVVTGDWWAPFYNEQPFFDKPVLFHQLQGLAMIALGQNELAARIQRGIDGLRAKLEIPSAVEVTLTAFDARAAHRLCRPV